MSDEDRPSEPPSTGRPSSGGGRSLGESSEAAEKARGPLAWMGRNLVAANLLMLTLIVGGLMLLPRIKQEVFPEFDLDLIIVNIAYPGASPAEVEQGVILATEEAVRGIDGIKEVRSTAAEGNAVVTIELLLGTDADRVLSDIKSAIDRVTSYPLDIERPIVTLAQNRREVISLVVYGDQSERALRDLADRIRDELLELPQITVVELAGARPLEISIEVPQSELRRYGLALEGVAQTVSRASVEVPGGGVKTQGGEVLVRTTERRDRGVEFGDIVVLSRPDGSEVKLGDIANIKDGFRDTDQAAFFNGQRAIMVKVFRVGDQTPIEISDVVKNYIEEKRGALPPGVKIASWLDWSEIYADRVDLLMRNGRVGLILVLVVLGLFLELRLAFWVTLGIPISFIGALLFLPSMGASINMISLFAFIVTLGLVVDDAIVVGEAAYTRRTEGASGLGAALGGVKEVAVPVVFAVLTTMIAFAPLLFVPGPAGKFFRQIPIVVIAVLFVSLIESLLILPAHLAHSKGASHGGVLGYLHQQQQRFSRGVEWFTSHVYQPFLGAALRRRYLTLAISLSMFVATIGLIAGGRLNFTFLPKVDGDVIVAELEMPYGTAVADTQRLAQELVKEAQAVLEEKGGADEIGRGIFSQVGALGSMRGGPAAPVGVAGGGHQAEVAVFLVPMDQRSFSSGEFANLWRKRLGEVAGVESLKFNFSTGPASGSPVEISLSHRDLDVLEAAASDLAQKLRDYAGVFDIDDGFSRGKEQLDFTLKPSARALGVSELDLARQIRSAFFGSEAVRQQRGRDELRVFVRLPEEERRSEHDIEELLIRTPGGGEIPLAQAVELERGRSYTSISRRDGNRQVSVTADVDPTTANATQVIGDVEKKILPDLLANYSGLSYSLEGEQRQQKETLDALKQGFLMALVGIFALLAVVFRSYIQPVIIMMVIPFGLVGAVLGHVLMGYDLSLMSMMGVVALSGVVVNDSLILIVAINEYRTRGSLEAGLLEGGARRFRPIILTSLTTFFGLVPMILETSVQARFLIPMAISLGFGVLFATGITLIMVPALYRVIEDAKSTAQRVMALYKGDAEQRHAPGE